MAIVALGATILLSSPVVTVCVTATTTRSQPVEYAADRAMPLAALRGFEYVLPSAVGALRLAG